MGLFGLAGGLANLFGASGRSGDREAQQALQEWLRLQGPLYDFSDLTPEELAYLGDLDPALYSAIVPEAVALPEEGKTRADQLGSLAYLQSVAREGMPLADRLQAQQATGAIARENTRAQDAILRNLAERGQAGGGMELQARLLGAQNLSQGSSDMGVGLAQEALARKYDASKDAANLASGIRSQDENLSGARATATNRFNELVSQMRTNAAAANAQAQNVARARNVTERQRVSDTNALNRQGVREGNLNRQNQLRQAESDFAIRRAAGASGQYGNLATRQDATQAARAANIRAIGEGLDDSAESAMRMFLGVM